MSYYNKHNHNPIQHIKISV